MAGPDLPLDAAQTVALENALHHRDYKQAEKLLVEEAERDPKSAPNGKITCDGGRSFFSSRGNTCYVSCCWSGLITPLDEPSRFTLAMAYIRLNRREWARPELERLASHTTEEPTLSLLAGTARLRRTHTTVPIQRFRHVIELNPKMMRAYDSLGLCYDYLGQLGEAIDNYNHAVQLNRLQAKPSAWPHLDLAISLVESNRLAEAEKHLHEAAGYDPRLPQVHFQLGRIFEMRGEHQAAIQSLNQAVTLDPTYADPHYLLGRIYRKLGERESAETEIERFQGLKKATQTQLATESHCSCPTLII